MQKVDKYISNLLYEHDCVIVPEWGGFVANYSSAKIHPTQHSFSPPSKNIVFNKNLKNNDGLLANHIAETENTSYPVALRHIQHFVDSTNMQLKEGVKINLEEIGTVYLDVEKNIQFEPGTTNYLLDAFGLSQFQSPAIKRDNIGQRIEREFKDRGAIPVEKKKIKLKRYVTIALALPLIFGIIWIPLKTDWLKNANYSNLNPFARKEVVKSNIKIESKKTIALPVEIKNNDTSLLRPVTPIVSSQPVTSTLVEPVKPDTTSVVRKTTTNVDLKYHLVAGCFQIEDNAIKFVNSLQKQNIPSAIIGQNNKGLYVVSCGDYASRTEANNQLGQIRKVQPEAWLFKM